MGRKRGARKASPTEEETTGAQHAKQTPALPETEEARPSVVPSTSSVQTPAIGTPQTPSIPLDLVQKLLASISPGFNLTHTLARLSTENTNPILVQPPTMPTPQPTTVLPEPSIKPIETPHEKLSEPSTKLTETLPEKEVELKPATLTSFTPKQSIDLQTPPKITVEIPTETSTKAPVDNPVTTREDPTAGSVGEKGRAEEEVRDEEIVEAGGERGEEKRVVESEVVVEAEEVLAYKEKELEAKAGEEPKLVEGIIEDTVESEESESESEKSVSEGEESGDSKETKVVSEERTEVVGREERGGKAESGGRSRSGD